MADSYPMPIHRFRRDLNTFDHLESQSNNPVHCVFKASSSDMLPQLATPHRGQVRGRMGLSEEAIVTGVVDDLLGVALEEAAPEVEIKDSTSVWQLIEFTEVLSARRHIYASLVSCNTSASSIGDYF
jgi:hypothetical protein